MSSNCFESLAGAYTLIRPGTNPKQPLRAWDAADEYLIQLQLSNNPEEPLLILNDQFGALGTCLNVQTVAWVSDSYCAHQSLNKNLTENQIAHRFPCYNPVEDWAVEQGINQALIKLPKNLSYLTFLLKKCSDLNIRNVKIAGMMKHLPKNILPFLQKFGEVNRLPFKKKATIYELSITKAISCPYPKNNTFGSIKLSSHANVFGRDKLDPGAAFVIDNINSLPKKQQVADLCSGSGILGLAYLNKHPESQVHFFDESYMAVDSSQRSCALNQQSNVKFSWEDGLSNSQEYFDLIICNPPFHEEHTVGDHIAKRLFSDAKQHLKPQGNVFIIGNRHLGYHASLKKYFKHVETIAANSKFILLKAYG